MTGHNGANTTTKGRGEFGCLRQQLQRNRAGLLSGNSQTTQTLGSAANSAAGRPLSPTRQWVWSSAWNGQASNFHQGADEPVIGEAVEPTNRQERSNSGAGSTCATFVGEALRPTLEESSPMSPASSRSTTAALARRRPMSEGYRGAKAVSAMLITAGSGRRSRSKPPSTIRRTTTLAPSSAKDSQPVACGQPRRVATWVPPDPFRRRVRRSRT